MAVVEISDDVIRATATPAEGRVELADSIVPGLALRITAKGARSWTVRARRVDGAATRVTIGSWPEIGTARARKLARKALGDIAHDKDTLAVRRRATAERKARQAERTVATALRDWQRLRGQDPDRAWSESYRREVARLTAREIVPVLGERPLRETCRDDWTRLVNRRRVKAPAMASLIYRVAASFLSFAEASGWISEPMLPRAGLVKLAPAPAPRERALSDEELRAIWDAAGREGGKARGFVRTLILSAARLLEVADLRAGEVDFEAATWTIPASRRKNRRALALPLSPLAVAQLRDAWPIEPPDPTIAIFGRADDAVGGFRGFTKLKGRLDSASGVRDWRFHDLRRTARTVMARLGVPSPNAEAALGHVSHLGRLERIYNVHDYNAEAADAARAWQAFVEKLVTSPLGSEQRNAR